VKTLYQRATLAELLLRKLPGIEDDHGRDGRGHCHLDRGTPTRSGPAGGKPDPGLCGMRRQFHGCAGPRPFVATALFARSLITTTLPSENGHKDGLGKRVQSQRLWG